MDIARMRAQLEARYPLVTTEVLIGTRVWEVICVQDEDTLLDFTTELDYFPYGFLLWEAAIGLSRMLNSAPALVAGKRVLELGTGVGLPGLVAQSLGASVCQTDYQAQLLWLSQLNAKQNAIEGITTFVADWQAWKHPERYDVILGSDILYDRSVHFYLEEVFARAVEPGGKLLLSDPGRPQAKEFAVYLEKQGWSLTLETVFVESKEEGKATKPVEISLLTVQPGV